jgi:hypothetical protein
MTGHAGRGLPFHALTPDTRRALRHGLRAAVGAHRGACVRGEYLRIARLSGCSSNSDGAAAGPTTTAGWKKSFTAKTCPDWLNVMTADERLTASRDLIRRLGARDTSDALAAQFVSSISQACGGSPQLGLADVAAGLATGQPRPVADDARNEATPEDSARPQHPNDPCLRNGTKQESRADVPPLTGSLRPRSAGTPTVGSDLGLEGLVAPDLHIVDHDPVFGVAPSCTKD